jgi:hypothetical protein
METKRTNVPEPEITSEGKYKCREENQEYENREDYNNHYMDWHPDGMHSLNQKNMVG